MNIQSIKKKMVFLLLGTSIGCQSLNIVNAADEVASGERSATKKKPKSKKASASGTKARNLGDELGTTSGGAVLGEASGNAVLGIDTDPTNNLLVETKTQFDRQIAAYLRIINEHRELIKQLDAQLGEFSERNEALANENANLRSQIGALRTQVSEYEEVIDRLQLERRQFSEDISVIRAENLTKSEENQRLGSLLQDANRRLDSERQKLVLMEKALIKAHKNLASAKISGAYRKSVINKRTAQRDQQADLLATEREGHQLTEAARSEQERLRVAAEDQYRVEARRHQDAVMRSVEEGRRRQAAETGRDEQANLLATEREGHQLTEAARAEQERLRLAAETERNEQARLRVEQERLRDEAIRLHREDNERRAIEHAAFLAENAAQSWRSGANGGRK